MVDCDTDNRYPECANIGDLQMANCVKHKLSLQRKFQSKLKLKEMASSAVAVNTTDVAALDHLSFPIPLSVTSDPPVPGDNAAQPSGVGGGGGDSQSG